MDKAPQPTSKAAPRKTTPGLGRDALVAAISGERGNNGVFHRTSAAETPIGEFLYSREHLVQAVGL